MSFPEKGFKKKMDELSKEKRIRAEIDRISVFFEDVKEPQKAVVEPLIKDAAFMRVSLDDLEKQIQEEGFVDEYQNGKGQSGKKQSAAVQAYNSLFKTYSATTALLFKKLPYVYETPAGEWLQRERAKIEDQLKFQYKMKYGMLDEYFEDS